MASINKVILIGNLGADPGVKYLESGAVVANFSIATTERYVDKEGRKIENTEWHDIELWNNQAKVAEQYLKRGDSVFIEGKIRTDKWQDPEGNERRKVRIRALSMLMLGKRENFQDQPPQQNQPTTPTEKTTDQQSPDETQDSVDDLPF